MKVLFDLSTKPYVRQFDSNLKSSHLSHAFSPSGSDYTFLYFNRQFTRRADLRLPPGCYGNLIINVKRGQSWPKRAFGVDPDRHDWAIFTFTIIGEVRSCCTEMMKNCSIFKARRAFSFDIAQTWLISMLANRQAQSWGICMWNDPPMIGHRYRKHVRDVWKSARRVNRLYSYKGLSQMFAETTKTKNITFVRSSLPPPPPPHTHTSKQTKVQNSGFNGQTIVYTKHRSNF